MYTTRKQWSLQESVMVSGIKSGAYVLEQKQRNALVLYIKKNVIGDSSVRSLSFDSDDMAIATQRTDRYWTNNDVIA